MTSDAKLKLKADRAASHVMIKPDMHEVASQLPQKLEDKMKAT